MTHTSTMGSFEKSFEEGQSHITILTITITY